MPKKCKVKQPNPYILAILTTTLAGLISVGGSYFTAGLQAESTLIQKQLESRANAYRLFLEKIASPEKPAVSQILHIGAMVEHLGTDYEIQVFEDQLFRLLNKNPIPELYWQLNADLNILRLHGSSHVSRIYDDILLVLLLRDSEVNWAAYPPEIVIFHERWQTAQKNGIAYGWEERISEDERLMIITIAKLTEVLIRQLKTEIHA